MAYRTPHLNGSAISFKAQNFHRRRVHPARVGVRGFDLILFPTARIEISQRSNFGCYQTAGADAFRSEYPFFAAGAFLQSVLPGVSAQTRQFFVPSETRSRALFDSGFAQPVSRRVRRSILHR
jgi:hypothetical protein